MENNNNDYHISFFKPTTPQAKANRNMVLFFVTIWAVAVFGFQILLRVLEKPVPEPVYNTFLAVWDNVKTGNASQEELREYAKVSLSVLGKHAVQKEHAKVLGDGLNWSIYQLIPEHEKMAVIDQIRNFQVKRAEIINISEASYIDAKTNLVKTLGPYRGLEENDPRVKLIATMLDAEGIDEFEEANKELVPGIMSLYLIHNRSFLTDFTFLGFPFHYFYSAIFLLVLFVGLCWMYCVKTDKINKRFNIED